MVILIIMFVLIFMFYLIESNVLTRKAPHMLINFIIVCTIVAVVIFGVPMLMGLFLRVSGKTVWGLPLKEISQTNGSLHGDWLGFWGGYLGSIIAIIGVAWTLNESKKNMNITLRQEKENRFKESRPFFYIDIAKNIVDKQKKVNYYSSLPGYVEKGYEYSSYKEYLTSKENPNGLVLRNISGKRMMTVKVCLHYSKAIDTEGNFDEMFMIKLIAPDSFVCLVGKLSYLGDYYFSEDDNDNYDFYDDKLSPFKYLENIKIYFTTELRERIKLVFNFDYEDYKERFHYCRDERILENKIELEKKKERDTDLKDLKENYRLGNFKETLAMSKQYGE